ncbi:MAG: hypothetical protein AB4352_10630 [Hormoscilla sp.]
MVELFAVWDAIAHFLSGAAGHGNREISVDIKILCMLCPYKGDRILSISLCYEQAL